MELEQTQERLKQLKARVTTQYMEMKRKKMTPVSLWVKNLLGICSLPWETSMEAMP
jgi:hypothetical protein